ncbi:MAG: hypothetical protein ACKVH1_11270, partial [Alphaproteobacteria bacterium]
SLAIPFAGGIYDVTGGFWWMFVSMAMVAGIVICAAAFLPRAGEEKRGEEMRVDSRINEPAGPTAQETL